MPFGIVVERPNIDSAGDRGPGSGVRESLRAERESLTEEAYAALSRRAPLLGHRATLAPGRGPDRAVLASLEGGRARSYLVVPESGLRIGRSPDADFRLDEEGARPYCASIQFEGRAGFVLYDLDPDNGTTVDGMRITRWVLQDGDVLSFGMRSILRFSLIDGEQERALRLLCGAPLSLGPARPIALRRRAG